MNEANNLEIMKLAVSMALQIHASATPLTAKDGAQPRNMPHLELVNTIYNSLRATLKDST